MHETLIKEDEYVKREVSAPRLMGWTLLIFTKLLGTFLGGYIRSFLLWKNGYTAFERMDDEEEEPMFYPSFKDEKCIKPPVSSVVISSTTSEEKYWDVFLALQEQLSSEILSEEGKSVILSLHKCYLEGSRKPSELAREFFDALDECQAMQPPMNMMCQERRHWSMKLAKESDERYQKGNPKSILDGVLFSVKDQFDIEGFETSYGTSFLAACRQPGETIPCVSILLEAGAILVGKTTMHEVGLGTVGINTKQGVPRNPWNPVHLTGGSSGGSAAIVASNLVAFSIGADGGGSIRIPSSFCGVIGLKTTFNRVPIGGCMHVCHTVGAIGPIASTIQDCAIVYAIMAALQDEKERWKSPWLHDFSLPLFPKIGKTLHGWKIGIYRPFFDHSDTGVLETCNGFLDHLQEMGAELVDIKLKHLNECMLAHSITIGSEHLSSMASACCIPQATTSKSKADSFMLHAEYWYDPSLRKQLNLETQISLYSIAGFSASMYVSAQKVRRKLHTTVSDAFTQCHVIMTPTVPCTAPRMPDGALRFGMSDLKLTLTLMRFCQLANLVGIPAISIPIGVSECFPVGAQFMAPQGDESVLLELGFAIEGQLRNIGSPKIKWSLN